MRPVGDDPAALGTSLGSGMSEEAGPASKGKLRCAAEWWELPCRRRMPTSRRTQKGPVPTLGCWHRALRSEAGDPPEVNRADTVGCDP